MERYNLRSYVHPIAVLRLAWNMGMETFTSTIWQLLRFSSLPCPCFITGKPLAKRWPCNKTPYHVSISQIALPFA